MGRPRKNPTLSEKLAAILLLLVDADGDPLIPEPQRSSNDPETIKACVEWDHFWAWELGGGNDPENLKPLPKHKPHHRHKTHGVKHGFAGSDRHKINKSKRLQEAREQREERPGWVKGAFPAPERPQERQKRSGGSIPSRPLPGTRESGLRRSMNGTVTKREKTKDDRRSD